MTRVKINGNGKQSFESQNRPSTSGGTGHKKMSVAKKQPRRHPKKHHPKEEQYSPPEEPPRKITPPKKKRQPSGGGGGAGPPRKINPPQKKKKSSHSNWFKDVRKLQRSTKLLIPKAPFVRVIREIISDLAKDFRIQRDAVEALREASEMYLVNWISKSNFGTLHAKRVTLAPKDYTLIKNIEGYAMI